MISGIAFFCRAIRAASQGGVEIGFHAEGDSLFSFYFFLSSISLFVLFLFSYSLFINAVLDAIKMAAQTAKVLLHNYIIIVM